MGGDDQRPPYLCKSVEKGEHDTHLKGDEKKEIWGWGPIEGSQQSTLDPVILPAKKCWRGRGVLTALGGEGRGMLDVKGLRGNWCDCTAEWVDGTAKSGEGKEECAY